ILPAVSACQQCTRTITRTARREVCTAFGSRNCLFWTRPEINIPGRKNADLQARRVHPQEDVGDVRGKADLER
ncbi:unnamed protein product, partial [Trichogramma brassicae]